jgi:hypothetical protein
LPVIGAVSRLRQRDVEGKTMHTHEIPKQDWRSTFDELSLTHAGAVVSVEILSPVSGADFEVLELPLTGMSLDRRGREAALAITMARGAQTHVTHVIERPMRIFIERTDDERDVSLQVIEADGTKTVVRFRERGSRAA